MIRKYAPSPMSPKLGDVRMIVDRLIQLSITSPPHATAQAWDFLSAAHIAGQNLVGQHFRVHWHMLRLAIKTRDIREAVGQTFRLVLAPLGHLLQRLPPDGR